MIQNHGQGCHALPEASRLCWSLPPGRLPKPGSPHAARGQAATNSSSSFKLLQRPPPRGLREKHVVHAASPDSVDISEEVTAKFLEALEFDDPESLVIPNSRKAYNDQLHECAISRPAQVEKAEMLLERMQQSVESRIRPNTVTYNLVLQSYAEAEPPRTEAAATLLARMEEAGASVDAEASEEPGVHPNVLTYTTVMKAYANMAPPKAEEAAAILRRMEASGISADVVAYTTVVNAYASCLPARDAQAEALVKEMEQLDDEDAQPNTVTYNSLITALVHARPPRLQDAKEVLERMRQSPSREQRPNTSTLSILINALANADPPQGAEAEALLREMEESDDPDMQPDIIAYNSMMHVYSVTGDPVSGKRLLKTMEAVGKPSIMPSLFTCNMLISAYANADPPQPENAQYVMRRMERSRDAELLPDTVSYSALIAAYIKCSPPRTQEAEDILVFMEDSGDPFVMPNTVTYNNLLATYANTRPIKLKKALQMLDDMHKRPESKPDTLSYNNILNAYANCRPLQLREMEKIVDLMLESSDPYVKASHGPQMLSRQAAALRCSLGKPRPSDALSARPLSVQTALAGHSFALGFHDSMLRHCGLQALMWRIHPFHFMDAHPRGGVDSRTFYWLAMAYVRKSAAAGLEVVRRMKAAGVAPNIQIYNVIISAVVQQRHVDTEMVRSILREAEDEGLTPDTVTYNTMMNAYASYPAQIDEAYELLEQMESRGAEEPGRPDLITYSTLLSAHANSRVPDVERAEALLQRMEGSEDVSLRPNTVAYNTMMKLYAGEGVAGRGGAAAAEELLVRMQASSRQNAQPTTVSFNTLISAYANALPAEVDACEKVLSDMEKLEQPEMTPDHISYSSVINAHGKASTVDPNRARGILDRMLNRGCKADVVLYSSLMVVCARADDEFLEDAVTIAQWAFDQVEKCNSHCYVQLIKVFGRCGQHDQVMRLLKKARAEHVVNRFVYNAAMQSSGTAANVLAIYEHMQKDAVAGDTLTTILVNQATQGGDPRPPSGRAKQTGSRGITLRKDRGDAERIVTSADDASGNRQPQRRERPIIRKSRPVIIKRSDKNAS
ncbi:hypothetical protein CYMTET_54196 [Cymbomonas tetramitiformis]|uniref:Uncharacterized protein n=1 Tax=Cymbomonas tetramitiformis TaxID=36881 RepID=A0AAE0BFL0_9CHLO|nr:hypothetical protein CYMTET_54196 [Cymbomonas tetramitiformis]